MKNSRFVRGTDETSAPTDYVFKSKIAETEQFANATPTLKYLTPGGGTQTLILDNMDGAKWLKGSTPIESIAPNKLPLIGN